MTQPFFKPQPKEPWSDWRMFGLLLPALISALGFFITGSFAFAFSDIGVIPGPMQSWMVIVGSALIIFGAEMNTPFTAVEVFRKILRKEANGWDTSALVVSLIGTVVNLLVTFASRLTLATAWKSFVLNWGPLLSGFAVACDYYGALVELGFLFGSYETRMESWLEEKAVYDAEHGIEPTEPIPEPVAVNPRWRAANIDDVRALRLNGERATLTRAGLKRALAEQRQVRVACSSSTVGRWVKLAKEGK